ncbi:alpha/beta fold hydrolase [Pokkaliibacter sp. CJK22405]|uniref:alpha/beta fold hydrolase n=1 Tax=Pokkaliibacter sp. CJK22405 TaxID=3384615 RepID=UPI00398495AB
MPQRFSVEVQGQGKDVILIHGLGSARWVWKHLAESLEATHRLHLLQINGFAGATAGVNAEGPVAAPVAVELAEYIRSNGLQKPTVIGHSMGGEIALMLAARYPDTVGKAVIVDAMPFYSLYLKPFASSQSMQPSADAYRQRLLSANDQQFRQMQTVALAILLKNQRYCEAVLQDSLTSERATIANAMHELMVTDLRPELGNITAPVTVIFAHDKTMGMTEDYLRGFYQLAYMGLKQVSFEMVKDSYHFVMLDQAEVFNRVVEMRKNK